MNTSLRLGLIAFLCAGLTGCAILPAVGLNLAAQGVLALTLGPVFTMGERAERERCDDLASKDIAVTEPVEIAIPTDEGEVQMFERVFWRPEFEGEGYPQKERSKDSTATEGKFVITERSILLVTPPGTAGVRIPIEIVSKVDLNPVHPYSMAVKSCGGRFDIFGFWQGQANRLDPEAAAVAAAKIKARVAAIHSTAHKGTEGPQ